MTPKLNPISEPKEIAYGTTIEEIKASYFNYGALRQPNYRLCQLNIRGSRYYYNLNADKVEFYPSVTTILDNVMPENKILTDWKLSLGKDKADAYTRERAYYGSFIHTQLQELLVTRVYTLDLIRERLGDYAKKNYLSQAFVDTYEEDAKEDILAFAKWARDYDVRPLAIEVALYHRDLKYAGLTDLVANMRKYPIGDSRGDERVNAICDFKTTRKEFHDSHAIQLELYRLAWNLEFEDTPIEHIANVAPKDWARTAKKAISYRFEWQTDNPILKRVPYLLGLMELEEAASRKIPMISGVLSLDVDVESNCKIMTLEEIVKNNPIEEEGDDPFTSLIEDDSDLLFKE